MAAKRKRTNSVHVSPERAANIARFENLKQSKSGNPQKQAVRQNYSPFLNNLLQNGSPPGCVGM